MEACISALEAFHARQSLSAFRGIRLQKSFGGDVRNFLGPLMRFARKDVRDSSLIRKTATELRIGATEYCSGGVA